MTSLSISVRSVAEASTCIHNGADMIDIQAPLRSSLGMTSPDAVRAILREVPPRFPISATLGEWMDWRKAGRFPPVPAGVAYLRIGLEGAAAVDGWQEEVARFTREVLARTEVYSEPDWVAVAYADWEAAGAPPPGDVVEFAAAQGFPVFLLDTWKKDGPGIFDLLEPGEVASLVQAARLRGLQVALAGSLRGKDLDRALSLSPDVLGVRCAAMGGTFAGRVNPADVRSVAGAISGR
jgi:(5-formylfuran-3-yl)methyl phosphate synthase